MSSEETFVDMGLMDVAHKVNTASRDNGTDFQTRKYKINWSLMIRFIV